MTTATTKGAIDPYADPGTASRTAVKALIMLLITFIMGTLCLQGFNLVFVQIGADVGAAAGVRAVRVGPRGARGRHGTRCVAGRGAGGAPGGGAVR